MSILLDTASSLTSECSLGRLLCAASRTLVFCNKIEACRDVENYLRRNFEGEQLKVRHFALEGGHYRISIGHLAGSKSRGEVAVRVG
jgi:hypothetical protein